MSKFFMDLEFLEGKQTKRFLGVPIGNTKSTIDLISIGIVSEDNREYYAVSKDFNLEEAWNRYDIQEQTPYEKQHGLSGRKIYWIRENVLKHIFQELLYSGYKKAKLPLPDVNEKQFTYKNLKKLIQSFGKTNKQIAKEVKNFCYYDKETRDGGGQLVGGSFIPNKYPNIELYGYYSAYDHVALCWLFGKMIDLPSGFPMYTRDLKQTLDEVAKDFSNKVCYESGNHTVWNLEETIEYLKGQPNYPKQVNEHNALADAKWNRELYKFLKTIK